MPNPEFPGKTLSVYGTNKEEDKFTRIEKRAAEERIRAKAKLRLRRIQEMAENFLIERCDPRNITTKFEATIAVKASAEIYDQVQLAMREVNP